MVHRFSSNHYFSSSFNWIFWVWSFANWKFMYTLPQKKRNFSDVASLLGKSVRHLIFDMTLGQGQKPTGTGINEHIKVNFLEECKWHGW